MYKKPSWKYIAKRVKYVFIIYFYELVTFTVVSAFFPSSHRIVIFTVPAVPNLIPEITFVDCPFIFCAPSGFSARSSPLMMIKKLEV